MDPFIYVYSVGGIIFGIGLFFAYRNGYIDQTPRGIRNLATCLVVLLFFMGLQGYLQYAPMQSMEPTIQSEPNSEQAETDVASQKMRGQVIDYVIMVGYFVAILFVGTWFGRGQKTTRDFFFGGQRFSWWLIAFSLVATTIGSYSFVKYSTMGYRFGLSSSQTYLNDWIWMPLFIFGWLPLLYFSKITSIPEYFSRRFNQSARLWATILLLVYLIGYVGVNLFTMGKVLNELIGWPIPLAAIIVAVVSCSYVTVGGQSSVIMTDLFQGLMLLITGVLILVLGMYHLGGFEGFWTNLPREHRMAFSEFNNKDGFPSVGVFWQDGVANSAMFYFLNQGIIMRFLAAKSVNESRKSGLAMIVILMTIGALVVGGGGWVAAAMKNTGSIPADTEPSKAFYVATEILSHPGVFGLILAALTAALMSTVDTLITAISAVAVNDVYKVYIKPDATERQLLTTARITAVSVTLLGVLMVPIFMMFDSIYAAHGAFTASATPPLVVALLLSVFWRRFTATAALCTMIGGLVAIGVSMLFPSVITPFAHGVPMGESGDGFLGGIKQFKFMRACYGISVCLGIGIIVSLFTRPEKAERQRGLVWGTISDAIEQFKGSPGKETTSQKVSVNHSQSAEPLDTQNGFHEAVISKSIANQINADTGDILYVSDSRWWLGGLKSAHCIVKSIAEELPENSQLQISESLCQSLIAPGRQDMPLTVEKLY